MTQYLDIFYFQYGNMFEHTYSINCFAAYIGMINLYLSNLYALKSGVVHDSWLILSIYISQKKPLLCGIRISKLIRSFVQNIEVKQYG